MGFPIPFRIVGWVAQAKIGAQIDNAWREIGKALDPFHRPTMWQTEEEQITAFQFRRTDELKLRAPAQVGVGEVHIIASVTLARDLLDGNVGVAEQQA